MVLAPPVSVFLFIVNTILTLDVLFAFSSNEATVLSAMTTLMFLMTPKSRKGEFIYNIYIYIYIYKMVK